MCCVLSCFTLMGLSATLWGSEEPAPLTMGFSREEYWIWWLCPPSGGSSLPGIEHLSPISCTGIQILYASATWEVPILSIPPGTEISSLTFKVPPPCSFLVEV